MSLPMTTRWRCSPRWKARPAGLANLQRHIRRDLAVGPAPNAVGAEIFTRHDRTFPEAKPRKIRNVDVLSHIQSKQIVTIRFRLLTLRGGVSAARRRVRSAAALPKLGPGA